MTVTSWLGLLTEPLVWIGLGLLLWLTLTFCRSANVALRGVAMVVVAIYFWLATPLGANIMVAALEDDVPADARCASTVKPPVIVVLAGGKSGTSLTSQEFWRLQETSFRRVSEAVALASRLPNSLLIVSGGSPGDVREADLMRALATVLGFPAQRLLVERESLTTYDSAVEVARLLRERQIDRVHLVTSALHMKRATAVFAAQGLQVCPYPVDRKWIRPRPPEALIPQISALTKSTDAVHEFIGWAWYWASNKL
ncbi:MAG: YdcF family protein [Gammaproteobacteria bacterium]|nr:YdcF family protein [Gammaproteobacteria bacterium]